MAADQQSPEERKMVGNIDDDSSREWARSIIDRFAAKVAVAEDISAVSSVILDDQDGLVGRIEARDSDGSPVGFAVPLVSSAGERRDLGHLISFASVYVDEKLRTRSSAKSEALEWFAI